jgi:hypothetical protein
VIHDRSFFRNCGTGARRGEALPDATPANYREDLCLPKQFSSSKRSFIIKERNGWRIYPRAVTIFIVSTQPQQVYPYKGARDGR